MSRSAFASLALAAFSFGFAALNAQQPPAKAEYEAHALSHEGDAARGRLLFAEDPRLSCRTCHSADGSNSKVGPDLAAIGDKFPRREMIRALLEPSADLAVGFGTTRLVLKNGGETTGVVRQAMDNFVELMGVDGRLQRFERADIAEMSTPPNSLMPVGLHQALTVGEFSDLVAHLLSLRAPPGQGGEVPKARRPVTFEPFSGPGIRLDHPVWCAEVPGRPGVFAVLEHYGQSWLVEKGAAGETQTPLLDLRKTVRGGGATGLLGMAFHPKFTENRRYFLTYQIVEEGKISTLVVERRFAADFRGDSGEPSRELLKLPAVTQDHNGGTILFGPDGFLYVGPGDTGPQRDPRGHGQDLGVLLGKILRLDVDRQDAGLPYAIPAGNPFVGREGARAEIWAYGFREPWRFSFDRETGDLWVGDVGQDRIEEVALVRVGENHGWNVFEGHSRFSERFRRAGEVFVPPVFSYPHRLGPSVTGGHVYRGSRAPALRGWYVFADFESRRIWALTHRDRILDQIVEIGRAPSRAVSFMETTDGELHLVGFDAGSVHRLALENVDPTPVSWKTVLATSEREPATWAFATETPPETWTAPSFDDSAWKRGPGGFGTQGTPGGVIRSEWRTADLWVRREFTLPQAAAKDAPRTFALRIHHDEDTEVYLNGSLAARLPRWTTGYVEIELTAEAAALLRPGRNVIALHCHQNGGGQYLDAGLRERSEGVAE